MRIYGSYEVQYFAYLLIIMYGYIVMHLNFCENYPHIGSIHAYQLLHAASMSVQHFHDF